MLILPVFLADETNGADPDGKGSRPILRSFSFIGRLSPAATRLPGLRFLRPSGISLVSQDDICTRTPGSALLNSCGPDRIHDPRKYTQS